MEEYIRQSTNYLIQLFIKSGLSDNLAKLIGEFSMLLILIIVSYIGYWITWKVMRKILIPLMQRSKNQFDDLLIKHKFFRKVSYLTNCHPAFPSAALPMAQQACRKLSQKLPYWPLQSASHSALLSNPVSHPL